MVRPTKFIEPINNASMEDVARALLRPKKKTESTETAEESTKEDKKKRITARAKTSKASTGNKNPSKKD